MFSTTFPFDYPGPYNINKSCQTVVETTRYLSSPQHMKLHLKLGTFQITLRHASRRLIQALALHQRIPRGKIGIGIPIQPSLRPVPSFYLTVSSSADSH